MYSTDDIIDASLSKYNQISSPEIVKKKKKISDSGQKKHDGSPYKIQKKDQYSDSESSVKAPKNPIQPTMEPKPWHFAWDVSA